MRARQRGFNLAEALVTLAVLGILLAVGIPQLGDWVRTTQVRSITETLVSGLQRARMEAMKRNGPVTLWLVTTGTNGALDNTCALSATSGAWVVSVDNPAGKCGSDPSTSTAPRIIDRYTPGGAVAAFTVAGADSTAAAASSVRFNAFGQVDAGGAGMLSRITVSHADVPRKLRVEVSTSGSVRMCDEAVTDATDPRKCRT